MSEEGGTKSAEHLSLGDPEHHSLRRTHSVSPWVIGGVVSVYWVVSLSVVFLNKYIMSSSKHRFPYPLFVTWFQLILALLILGTLSSLKNKSRLLSLMPEKTFDLPILVKMFDLALIYVAMLSFNNLCLKYVEVTFYQMARSLTIIFNIIFIYTITKTTISRPVLVCCIVVFVGFTIGSYGEINFTWPGLIFGVGSSFFVALYGIYVKRKLALVKNDEWELMKYNTTLSTIFLFPVVVLSGDLAFLQTSTFLLSPRFWFIMIFTGIMAFLINVAVFLQIKFTTPLTNTISGTAKACAQTVLAFYVFGNPISFLNGVGIFLTMLGSIFYSFFKYKEMMSQRMHS